MRSYAPFPGFHGAAPQIATYDSIRFELGGAAARDGFESGLVRAIAIPRVPAEPTTHAVVHLGGGSFGYDTNALAVERGDSLRLLRAEATALENRSAGVLDRSGHHMWQVAGRWITKPARFDWGFGHRGTARYVIGGEETAGGGESGFATITREVGALALRARFERGYDRRESFGGFDRPFSRRDAQSTRGGVDATFPYRGLRFDARVTLARDEAHRTGGGAAFESSARWAWASLGTEAPLGGGVAELAAGVGRHGALDGLDPSVSAFWRTTRGGITWRGGIERALRAVWLDLGPGEVPFLQSTWAGALSAERRGAAWSWRGWAHGGRATDRALASHQPLEDLWLRDGFVRDVEPYDFALAGADLGWRRGRWSARGEGFLGYRSDRSFWPRYDPANGARGEVEYRFALFGGDLGVGLRGGGAWIGPRESFVFEFRDLPGYVTSEAALTLALGQAWVVVHGRNFENRRHAQPWPDTFDLTEALSTGRELRFLLTVRLFN